MKSTSFTISALTTLMLAAFAAAPAAAQQSAPRWSWSSPSAVTSDPFKFSANIWAWFPWAPVTLETEGQSIFVPEGVDTIYGALDLASMTEFEVHKGPFGAYVSPIYYHGKFSETIQGPEGENRDFFIKEKVLFIQYGLSYDLGTYRLGDAPDSPTVMFQPFVGGSYFYDHYEAEVGAGKFLPGFDKQGVIRFNTPIIGLNSIWDYSDAWTFRLGGYYGGFANQNVEYTYEVVAAAAYHFTAWDTPAKAYFGYRHTFFDYDDGDVDIEVNVTGPFVGIGFEF